MCLTWRGYQQNIQECSPACAMKVAAKAVGTAKRQQMAAKTRRRKDLLTAERKALKEAEKDPTRPFPVLSRPQAATVKTEMRRNPNIRVEALVSADLPLWEPPVPETPAAKAERLERRRAKKRERQAKAERRQEKFRAHINKCITAKRERCYEPSMVMVPPPPPQVSFSV